MFVISKFGKYLLKSLNENTFLFRGCKFNLIFQFTNKNLCLFDLSKNLNKKPITFDRKMSYYISFLYL